MNRWQQICKGCAAIWVSYGGPAKIRVVAKLVCAPGPGSRGIARCDAIARPATYCGLLHNRLRKQQIRKLGSPCVPGSVGSTALTRKIVCRAGNLQLVLPSLLPTELLYINRSAFEAVPRRSLVGSTLNSPSTLEALVMEASRLVSVLSFLCHLAWKGYHQYILSS